MSHPVSREQSIDLIQAAFVAAVSGIFLAISRDAMSSAGAQYVAIVAQVDEAAEDIYEEIDRAQSGYLSKGIESGGQNVVSYSEFAMRDQSHQALQVALGERQRGYGNYYIRVSAHPSSCPLCIPWQDAVLIDDENAGGVSDGRTALLSEAKAAGLGHFNCRHTWLPYIPGYSYENVFARDEQSPEQTAKEYAVEQQQRYNERMIRERKRREEGNLTAAETNKAKDKVLYWQARQRALKTIAERHGVSFYRQYSREQIGGVTSPQQSRF